MGANEDSEPLSDKDTAKSREQLLMIRETSRSCRTTSKNLPANLSWTNANFVSYGRYSVL